MSTPEIPDQRTIDAQTLASLEALEATNPLRAAQFRIANAAAIARAKAALTTPPTDPRQMNWVQQNEAFEARARAAQQGRPAYQTAQEKMRLAAKQHEQMRRQIAKARGE